MKKSLILLLVLVFVANSALGSPLIFKVTKSLDSKNLVELGTFDATKYRQIRIGIKVVSSGKDVSENKYEQLIQKRAELHVQLDNMLRQYVERSPMVADKRKEIAQVNIEIKELEESVSTVDILGIEGTDDVFLSRLTGRDISSSIVIDTPPSKISVKVSGKGIYSLYVWGQ